MVRFPIISSVYQMRDHRRFESTYVQRADSHPPGLEPAANTLNRGLKKLQEIHSRTRPDETAVSTWHLMYQRVWV